MKHLKRASSRLCAAHCPLQTNWGADLQLKTYMLLVLCSHLICPILVLHLRSDEYQGNKIIILIRLFDGLSGLVEQAALNFEAVTHPALCSNHTLLSAWSLVASSTVSASLTLFLSSLKVVSDFCCNSCSMSSRFSSLNSSVNGFGTVLFSTGSKAAL